MNQTTKRQMIEDLYRVREAVTEGRASICQGWPDGTVPGYVRDQLNNYDAAIAALDTVHRYALRLE